MEEEYKLPLALVEKRVGIQNYIRTVLLILIPCILNAGVVVDQVVSTQMEKLVVPVVGAVKKTPVAPLDLEELVIALLTQTNKVQESWEWLVEMENVTLLMPIMLVVAVVLVQRVNLHILAVLVQAVMDLQLL